MLMPDTLFHQLVAHIFGLFLLGRALGTQEVGEKEQFNDDKEDKDLDGNDEPQRLANSHAAESIVVQMEHARPKALFIFPIITHDQKVQC